MQVPFFKNIFPNEYVMVITTAWI